MEQMPSGEVPVIHLPGMGSLLARTGAVYKRLLKPLFSLSICLGITFLIVTGLTSLLNFFVLDSSHVLKSFIQVINTLINFVALFAYALFFTAMLYVIKHRDETMLTVGQSIAKAKPVYRSLLWISIIAGLAAYGSALTVVLPILMIVWLYFAVYIVVAEERRGIEAITRGRYLTRGVWFATIGRYFSLVAIVGAIVFVLLFILGIPAVGGVLFALVVVALALLVVPFFAVFDYLRYEDLVALPRSQAFRFFKGERNMIVFFAIVGLLMSVFMWISSLLTCETRTNVANVIRGGLAVVLMPIAQNAGQNINSVVTVLDKMVYVYTPDICPAPVDMLENTLQYNPRLYNPSVVDDGSGLDTTDNPYGLQPSAGSQDLYPNDYPIQNP